MWERLEVEHSIDCRAASPVVRAAEGDSGRRKSCHTIVFADWDGCVAASYSHGTAVHKSLSRFSWLSGEKVRTIPM